MELNNRELASIIWITVVVALLMLHPQGRSAITGVLKVLASGGIVTIAIAAMTAYLGGVVFAASRMGLWSPDLIYETVLWFLAVGMVLFFSVDRALREHGYFRTVIRQELEVTALLTGFINLVVFSLVVELLLLPAVTLLVGVSIVAATRGEFATLGRGIDQLLGVLGIALIGYTVVVLLANWSEWDQMGALRTVVLPAWLTVALFPFIYGLALFMSYENLFRRVQLAAEDDPRARWRGRVALVTTLGGRLRDGGPVYAPWARELAEVESLREGRQTVRNWLSEKK